MGGGKTISTSAPRIAQVNIQTSAFGLAQTIGWGTFRSSCNIIWVGDFTSIPITSTQKTGGKGGSPKTVSTTYSYEAALMLGMCAGPITGVRTVYRDKSVFIDAGTTALAQAGLSVALGTNGQAPWSYLTSFHPSEALGYSGLAYVYASGYPLNDYASLPNHGFEVVSAFRETNGATILDDANPRDIVVDFLTNASYGVPYWGADLVGNLDDYALFSKASNFLLSPCIDAQRTARDFLEEVFRASNSDAIWSDGVIKVRPMGDTAITGNGVTWTPDLIPLYDLTDDDFTPARRDDPVVEMIARPSDSYNYIQLEFTDRTRQYNPNTIPAYDQANVEEFGKRQNDSPISLKSICDPLIAAQVVQTLLQRSCYVRRKFTFSLDWRFSLLEPMDKLTLTSGDLVRMFVRINTITEREDGGFDLEAEEMLVGVGGAALYGRQQAGGYVSNYDAPPGDIEDPLIFLPLSTLTAGTRQAWAAISGQGANWGGCDVWVSLDGDAYQFAGKQIGRSRYGVSTTTLAVAADPDTTNTLGVDLTISGGNMETASQADVDAAIPLFILGPEVMAYRDATLTAANEYDLDYLRRGIMSSSTFDHAIGEPFVRLDDAVFRYAYPEGAEGSSIFMKFLSFNVYGRATQSLADVTAYTLDALSVNLAPPDPVIGLSRSSPTSGTDVTLYWTASARATIYKIEVRSTSGGSVLRYYQVTGLSWTYPPADQTVDAINPVVVTVIPSNFTADGVSSEISVSTGGTVGTQPPATTITYIAGVTYKPPVTIIYDLITGFPDIAGYVAMVTLSGSPYIVSYASSPTSQYITTGVNDDGTYEVVVAGYSSTWGGDMADLNFSSPVEFFRSF